MKMLIVDKIDDKDNLRTVEEVVVEILHGNPNLTQLILRVYRI